MASGEQEAASLPLPHHVAYPPPSRKSLRCPSSLASLADLPHEHRDTQPFAHRLAWQELALPLWQLPPLAVVLRVGVGEETGA